MKDFIAGLLVVLFGVIVYILQVFICVGIPLLMVLWIFKKMFL